MKYEHPINVSQEEIIKGLSSDDSTHDERVRLVLSAMYYSPIPFAGDILLDEFDRANGLYKRNLLNLFGTFYHMLGTDYRVQECLSKLRNYKLEEPSLKCEIDELIEEIEERMIIFGYR